MPRPFVLPDLGEGLTEAEIVKVLVQEGDRVQEDAPLLEVETDKATVEIPSPVTGRVAKIHVQPGQTVKVGAVLVTFDEEAGRGGAASLGTTLARSAPPAGHTTSATQQAPAATAAAATRGSGPVAATPATRRLARELGADIPELDAIIRRNVEPARQRGVTLTLTSFLLKAAALALREHPQFNASLDPAAGELILKRYCHLGVAVATDRGLIVPVIRDVDKKPLIELQGELAALAQRVRDGKATLEDLRGGTFTVTNIGALGGTGAVPIINYPEVAILGAARAGGAGCAGRPRRPPRPAAALAHVRPPRRRRCGRRLGGACLWEGCIPSKALLHVSAVLGEVERAKEFGVDFGEPRIALDALRKWKAERVVGKLARGLAGVAKAKGVEIVGGRGVFEDSRALRVEGDEPQKIRFKHAVVATGSAPSPLPGAALASDRVMDSTGALELSDLPERLLVIGGGYIGLELGQVYTALGSKVTLVEMTDGLLPGVDRDLVQPLARHCEKLFVKIRLGTKVTSLHEQGSQIEARFGEGDTVAFDRVLVAVGRRPVSAELGLETTRVRPDAHGFVAVDERGRTADPRIRAVGDATAGPMLAHRAARQGMVGAA